MSDNTPLKPCPFCGDRMELRQDGFVRHAEYESCILIGVIYPLQRWNTRAKTERESELETLAGELAEALKAVVNSAVDPEKAVFASMVKLEPLRAALARFAAMRDGLNKP